MKTITLQAGTKIEIKDNQTLVVAVRHEEHGEEGKPKNSLINSGRSHALQTGKVLKDMGVVLDAAFCSPQGRALETLLCVMQGMDKVVPIETDPRQGDLVMDPAFNEEKKAALKAEAKAAGVDTKKYFVTAPSFRQNCLERGLHGAASVLDQVHKHPGKIIGYASHGGSRMEITIATLAGMDPQRPQFYYDRGTVALLVFEDGEMVEVFYLGDVVEQAAQARADKPPETAAKDDDPPCRCW